MRKNWLAILYLAALYCSEKADAAPFIATIGVMVPLSVATPNGPVVPLTFRQMATSIILAIHHVNTRNGTIVGDVAKSLPDEFRLVYKLADTHFSIAGGVKAILDWRAQEGYAGFETSCGSNLTASIATTNNSSAKYSTSSSKDKILSIVGPDLSEISAAVVAIASLGGTPVTSYFSVSTTLSDKTKFPLFSRTVPAETFNMIGMASVMKSFGWRQCAVLFSDSEYGGSFAAAFQQRAGIVGITILTQQKFKNLDRNSIFEGVTALKNSGARVFVFLSQGNVNLESTLLAANISGIGGRDGYVWLAGELGDSNPENIIKGLSTPPAILRSLFFGWMVLSPDALYGSRRTTFESVFASVDPALVYDPLVNLAAAGFSPPRNAYDAYAYDAVWATALGIAAWRSNTSRDIVSGIRSSRFPGASGPVSFDNVTGDRAPSGLIIRLLNIRTRGGNTSDWATASLVMTAIGMWELSQGFMGNESDAPYWPGGSRSWVAPWDGLVNSSTGSENIPFVQTSTGVIVLSVVITSAVLLLAATVASSVILLRIKAEEPDVKMLRQTITDLRTQLRIRATDGFVLSGERVSPWMRRKCVVIRRGYMESAARLAMWTDFDLRLMDAFCVCLLGDEYVESEASGALSLATSTVERHERSTQYERLCGWLLELSVQLLDPCIQELASRADAKLERYAVVPQQPFTSADHSGRMGVNGLDASIAFSRTSSSRTMSSPDRHGGGRRFSLTSARAGTFSATFGRLVSSAVVRKSSLADTYDLEEHDALGLCSSATRRFEFFESKVLNLQIWREDGGELFAQLKERLQIFMDELATLCNERFDRICSEERGTELCAFRTHELARAEVTKSEDAQAPRGGLTARIAFDANENAGNEILRQDHDEVGAVRMDVKGASFREAELQVAAFSRKTLTPLINPYRLLQASLCPKLVVLDEEIFLSQLILRARLLNDEFQRRVADAIHFRAAALSENQPIGKRIDPTNLTEVASNHHNSISVECLFKEGIAPVSIFAAPPKRLERMREKLAEYAPPHPNGMWPLTANILDPVLAWFTEHELVTGLKVVRIKNKFASQPNEIFDGYRDLSLSVLLTGTSGLSIIGEIQIHDTKLHDIKLRMHKLYKVKRAPHPGKLQAFQAEH